jgi:hypothetical protein
MFLFQRSTVFTTQYLLLLSEPVYIAPVKQRSYNITVLRVVLNSHQV